MNYPISIKGVVVRNEWELPGGRIEPGETPEQCVAREIVEETRWKAIAGPLLDTWMYQIEVVEKHVLSARIAMCGIRTPVPLRMDTLRACVHAA